jgi:heme ABC exporter ATP-binding subunit CcmA
VTSPAVDLREAVVMSGSFPLLAGLTFCAQPGTFVVLRGGNGAGKTSALRLLGGLERLNGGSGRVLDIDLSSGDRRGLRRRVGWMGHEGSFYEDLTVRENLEFAARSLGRPVEEIDPALERVGLGHRRSTPTRQLSAGQRRRLALGWILVRRPELWLLDEPHAALDRSARDLVDQLVLEALSVGVTVVVSAHDQLDARLVPDQVLVLSGGRVVEES